MTYTLVIWIMFMGTPVTRAVVAHGLALEDCERLRDSYVGPAVCVPEIEA